MVGAMRLATVGVTDMQQALGLFRDIMRLKVERRGPVPAALLKAWRLPAGTSAHMAELSCKGYPVGRLRLVEFDPTPTQRVRLDFGSTNPDSATDVGIKALDFYVADPILPSVRKIEAAGFKFRSRPVKHQIGDTISEECLFSGPDGVPILIMVGHRHAATSLRAGSPDGPFSEVPTISVVAADLPKTRAFYEGVLGLTATTDVETGDAFRDLVDDLTGVPHGTRVHFLMYAQPGEASGKILLVHFFERTGKRLTGRMKPGNLGFSLLTHDTDDINALYTRLRAVGADVVTPPTQIEGDGAPYRMMLAKGPNEELFEFVQAGAGPVIRLAAKKAPAKAAAKKKPAKKAAAKVKAKPAVKSKAKPKGKSKSKAQPKAKPKAKAKAKVKAKPKAKSKAKAKSKRR